MRIKTIEICIIGACLLFAAMPAMAARKALLIGVSDYASDEMNARVGLVGPGNDVLLIKKSLAALKFHDDNIVILTGKPNSDEMAPTRERVIRSLAALEQDAKSGDFISIYFSGHGAQQPAREHNFVEPDGLDEILLLADSQFDDTHPTRVTNALIDNELSRAVGRIRNKGAFIWLIVDACHSAGMNRAASPGLRSIVTGFPARIAQTRALRPDLAGMLDIFPSTGNIGGIAAFFASSVDQPAYERLQFDEDTQKSIVYGQMTFHLAKMLRTGRAGSLRDLSVLLQAAIADSQGRKAHPQFWGSLEYPITLGKNISAIRPIFSRDGALWLSAGMLDGVRVADEVTLRKSDDMGSPAEIATVMQVYAGEARLGPSLGNAQLQQSVLSTPAQWVAFFRPHVPDERLSVAIETDKASWEMANQILETYSSVLKYEPAAHYALRVHGDEAAIVRKKFENQPLILVPSDITARRVNTDVFADITRLARANTLMEVISNLDEVGETADLEVNVKHRRHPRDSAVPCHPAKLAATGHNEKAEAMAPSQSMTVDHCDVLDILVEYTGAGAVDVTALYWSANGEISFVGDPNNMRLTADENILHIPITITAYEPGTCTPLPSGPEDIVVLAASHATPLAAPVAYSRLASANMPTTRGEGGADLLALFRGSVFASGEARLSVFRKTVILPPPPAIAGCEMSGGVHND